MRSGSQSEGRVTRREDGDMSAEAEIGGIHLQAKEPAEWMASGHLKLEQTRRDPPREPSERKETLGHLDLGLPAPRINSCCFKPSSLWPLVTAALGISYTSMQGSL